MTGREFQNSKWCQQAKRKDAEGSISKNLPIWQRRVKNLSLVGKAQQLWTYITSGQSTASDKILVLGALTYLISPIDLVPDVVPIIGFLDDLGVATFVLSFLANKITEVELDDAIVTRETTSISADSVSNTGKFSGTITETGPLAYKLEVLKEMIQHVDAPEFSNALDDIESKITEPFHQIIFAGRYNTGKSTLLNALLGQQVLPTGPVPTTKAITYILGANALSLCSQDSNGTITVHADIADLKHSGNAAIKDAVQVSICLPAECLHGGICMIDSPGLEDPDFDHSSLTLEAVPRADAVVVVLDASLPLSAPEYEFIQGLLSADRERKLFIVLNKADKRTPDEIASVMQAVRDHLRNLNIEPRIFALSARKAAEASVADNSTAIPSEFLVFQDELLRFVRDGISKERRRHIATRISALEENLRSFCRLSLTLAKEGEAEQAKAIAGAERCRAETAKAVASKQEQLEQSLVRAERRFQANLKGFLSALETTLWGKIAGAGLDDLRRTDLIGRFVKDESKSFVEQEMEALHRDLSAETSAALYDLQTALHGLPMQIVPTLGEPIVKPGMIAPAIVILSFPFLGVFSWLYLCIAATFGRSAIDSLFGGLLDGVGVSRIREELIKQLQPKLQEFGKGIENAVEQHFIELRSIVAQQLNSAAQSALGPVGMLREVPESGERKEQFCRLLEKLDAPITIT